MTDTVNMPTAAPSRKVVGATTGAGLGAVAGQLVVWGLDEWVFDPAIEGSVPEPVAAFVLLAVPLLLAFAGGYFTRRKVSELPPSPPTGPGI